MRKLTALVAGLVLSSVAAHGQASPETGAYAITDARVVVGDGHVLEHSTILLRDGLIQAIGADVKIPADAEIVKGTGLVAYPGFIDAYSTRGLKLPEWQADQDRPPDTSSVAPASMREANRKGIRPELRAADCLALTDALLGPMRQNGFTTALLAPADGNISGVCALVNLSGWPRRYSLLDTAPAMNMSFSSSNTFDPTARPAPTAGTGYPGSLLGIIANMRQTLLDADHLRVVRAGFKRAGGARPPVDDSLAALAPVLDGKLPVLFNAGTQVEIDRAIRLADEFHLRLILNGAGEAWKEAADLSRRGIPVIASLDYGDEPGAPKARPDRPGGPAGGARPQAGAVSGAAPPAVPGVVPPPAAIPVPGGKPGDIEDPAREGTVEEAKDDEDDTPRPVVAEQHRKWNERIANAAELEKAGVEFALSANGLKSSPEFWKNLRRAIEVGLPKEAALRALTINPAKILGIARSAGTLEKGKIANVILMTGDLADAKARVKYVFIDKSRFEPDRPTAAAPTPPTAAPTEEDEE